MAIGGQSQSVPKLGAIIILPEMLDPQATSTSRINRIHNSAVKEGVKFALRVHHRKRIPHHFNFWRQKKYNYKDRRELTKTIKIRKSKDRADLVRSGKTKREMIRSMRSLKVGGSAAGGEVRGQFTLQFPPGMKNAKVSQLQKVTLEDMKTEIARWTRQEEVRASEDLMKEYKAVLDRRLTKRARRRVSRRLHELGVNAPIL